MKIPMSTQDIFLIITVAISLNSMPLRAENENRPEVAEEQILTGKELLDSCTADTSTDSEEHKFCMVFMVGLVQHVSLMQQSGESPPLICVDPNQVTPEAVRDSAVRWMKLHESRMDEAAYILVTEALHQAYPCPSMPTPPTTSLGVRHDAGHVLMSTT